MTTEPLTSALNDRAACARRLVEQHGLPDQRRRYLRGLMLNEEVRDLARDVLFRPLDRFRRHAHLSAFDVRHAETCPLLDVTFGTRAPGGMPGEELVLYQQISALIHAHGALIEHHAVALVPIVEHWGRCRCGAEAVSRSASVRVAWAGDTLVREYAL